jgi:hypothetical protein
MGAQSGEFLVVHGDLAMNEKSYSRRKGGSAYVQSSYESKLRAWAFDCQQNQSPPVQAGGLPKLT